MSSLWRIRPCRCAECRSTCVERRADSNPPRTPRQSPADRVRVLRRRAHGVRPRSGSRQGLSATYRRQRASLVTTSRRLAAILLGLALVAGPAAATIFGTGGDRAPVRSLSDQLRVRPAVSEPLTVICRRPAHDLASRPPRFGPCGSPPAASVPVRLSGGAVKVRAGSGGSPTLSAPVQLDDGGGVSSASLGLASWYDDGAGLYAAVPGWQWGDTPYKLRVCHEGRCVTVTVRDACRCPGSRLIDLSRDAFRRLAPLSVGVIVVTVTGGAAAGPLPATSTDGR
jgi:hypothetical protein